jgi:hypothetical protein
MLSGLQVGNYRDEIPKQWTASQHMSFSLQKAQHSAIRFANGITSITEGDEIRTLQANKNYTGESKRGVKIGDSLQAVMSAYGRPTLSLPTTQGDSLVYMDQGVTFQFRDGKVVSWIVY